MSDDSVPSGQQGYPGWQTPSSSSTDGNVGNFRVEQMLARVRTAQLVKVQKVTTQGQVGPVGFVNITPMVKLQDGQGNNSSHGTINNIPFFRLQGGADKAIIMDPKAGDIGIAVFADRDISAVKKNKKESPAGSYRKHDMADGLYLGSFLANTPRTYIRFTDDNKIISSPDGGTTLVTLEENKITLAIGGGVTVVMTPTDITLTIGSMLIKMTSARIDLGGLGGTGVVTDAGVSAKVFAVL